MIFKPAAGYLLAAAAFARQAEAKLGRNLMGGIFGEVETVDVLVAGESATDGDGDGVEDPETADLLYTPDNKFVDEMCVDYCNDYFFTYCQHHNTFLNRRRRRRMQEAGEWDPEAELERVLVETQESEPHRGSDWTNAMQDCQEECMKWPRPQDPMTYWNSPDYDEYYDCFSSFVSNIGGDTYWCRHRHMTMATVFEAFGDFQGGFMSASAFHCSFAGIHGAGICRDSTVGGTDKTAYELERDKQKSRVHFGYCDVMDNGKIVDCTGLNTIHDDNLETVLGTMPENMEVLFLNGIEGITELPNNIFGNLPSPEKLKALYINQCDITGVVNLSGQSPFSSLVNLEVLNFDENKKITNINSGLLTGLTKLKQFSMYDASITTLPDDLFDDCKETLEVMTIYCLGGDQAKLGSASAGDWVFPLGFFDGMENLEMMSFVFCDFNSTNFHDDLFNDLKSLKWFDFFGNTRFTELRNEWFNCGSGCGSSKMGDSLLRFAFWGTGLEDCVFDATKTCINPDTTAGVGDKVFKNLDKLETVWFYNTDVTVVPPMLEERLGHMDHFEHLALGSPWYNPTSTPSAAPSMTPSLGPT